MRKITIENYRAQKEYPRIVAVVAEVLARQGFVAPIDVFLCMGLLDAENLTKWKCGRTPYLERVLRCNLSRASAILRILRFHAHDLNLGPSITRYMHHKIALQFSKTGESPIEEAYSRHFVVIGKKKPPDGARVHSMTAIRHPAKKSAEEVFPTLHKLPA